MLPLLLASVSLTSASPLLQARNTSCPSSFSSDPGPGYEHHTVGTQNGTWPWQMYKSSNFTPPVWQINRTDHALAPGHIIVATAANPEFPNAAKQPAATIFSDDGQLVWSSEGGTYSNLVVSRLNGSEVLVYWATSGGESYGYLNFLDNTYNTTTLCPELGLVAQPGKPIPQCQADAHEAFVSNDGTLLVPGLNYTAADLTSIGGSANACVGNSMVFEIEIETGEVLFSWNPMDYVPFTASHITGLAESNCSDPVDWFHINSIEKIGSNYLVSGRYTSTIFLIDSTGDILWQFNGQNQNSSFALLDVPGTSEFKFQHHVRAHNFRGDTFDLSLFNNNELQDDQPGSEPAELMLFEMHIGKGYNETSGMSRMKNGTAALQRKILTNPEEYIKAQGSYQPNLSGGHQLGAWGVDPLVREYGPTQHNTTEELWSGRCGNPNEVVIYRGYKQEWHATPADLPSLVVESNSTTGAYNGFVSWNGATDVASWNVYVSSSSEDDLQLTGSVAFRGFETMFDVPCWATYVQVGAQEASGEVRNSSVVAVP